MKVNLGTLKDKGEELAGFLEPRVGTKPELAGDSLEMEDGSLRKGVRPRQVKTYIKRFLYVKGLRKNYRVFVEGGELTVQELELGEEEEEKKEKTAEKLEKAEKAEEEEREGERKGEEEPEKAEEGKEAKAEPAEKKEKPKEEKKGKTAPKKAKAKKKEG